MQQAAYIATQDTQITEVAESCPGVVNTYAFEHLICLSLTHSKRVKERIPGHTRGPRVLWVKNSVDEKRDIVRWMKS